MGTAVSFVHTAQCHARQFNKGQGVVLMAHNKLLNSSDSEIQSPNNLVPEMREGTNRVLELFFWH